MTTGMPRSVAWVTAGSSACGVLATDDQEIDAARHQILDVGNLLGVVMAGIRDQQLLDDVLGVMRRLLKRVQADDAPAVAEAGVGEADDVRRGFLNFDVSRMQTSIAGLNRNVRGAPL